MHLFQMKVSIILIYYLKKTHSEILKYFLFKNALKNVLGIRFKH